MDFGKLATFNLKSLIFLGIILCLSGCAEVLEDPMFWERLHEVAVALDELDRAQNANTTISTVSSNSQNNDSCKRTPFGPLPDFDKCFPDEAGYYNQYNFPGVQLVTAPNSNQYSNIKNYEYLNKLVTIPDKKQSDATNYDYLFRKEFQSVGTQTLVNKYHGISTDAMYKSLKLTGKVNRISSTVNTQEFQTWHPMYTHLYSGLPTPRFIDTDSTILGYAKFQASQETDTLQQTNPANPVVKTILKEAIGETIEYAPKIPGLKRAVGKYPNIYPMIKGGTKYLSISADIYDTGKNLYRFMTADTIYKKPPSDMQEFQYWNPQYTSMYSGLPAPRFINTDSTIIGYAKADGLYPVYKSREDELQAFNSLLGIAKTWTPYATGPAKPLVSIGLEAIDYKFLRSTMQSDIGDSQQHCVTWRIKNEYPYTIHLKFYSQDRNYVWPSINTVYVLDNNKERIITTCGIKGEQICYGAWSSGKPSTYWGVGQGKYTGCKACCHDCENIEGRLITLIGK